VNEQSAAERKVDERNVDERNVDERNVDENGVDVVSADRRARRDKLFVVLLAGLLVTSAAAVVRGVYPPRPTPPVSASGEIRPVDPGSLQRQLRSGRLSDHPARHWRPAGPSHGDGDARP
jgi:hypothetical protein